ncbi:MAG: helix-turn-helix domain-containing protein [Ilumatobacteraceae bacterium]
MSERSAFPGFEAFADDAGELIERLIARRQRLGLSQAEVAERMGTSQPAVARLESGRSDARLSTLARYADALDTKLGFAVEPRGEAT